MAWLRCGPYADWSTISILPKDSPIKGRDAQEIALSAPVLSTVTHGGPKEDRIANFPLGGITVAPRKANAVSPFQPCGHRSKECPTRNR